MDFQKFEDTKGIIRSRKSKKDRQYNWQKKKDKTIYKTPHRKLTIEEHEQCIVLFIVKIWFVGNANQHCIEFSL